MALSDHLKDLAGRTKRLEEAAATVHAKNAARLEEQRPEMKSAMEAHADRLRTSAAKTRARLTVAG
ncbi:MAG TPA: hypothetical protein VN895_03205 [Candidatus Acidoferrum sp.]|nr:hypothetical protein [Candidatus Acidoferrum sp.]